MRPYEASTTESWEGSPRPSAPKGSICGVAGGLKEAGLCDTAPGTPSSPPEAGRGLVGALGVARSRSQARRAPAAQARCGPGREALIRGDKLLKCVFYEQSHF